MVSSLYNEYIEDSLPIIDSVWTYGYISSYTGPVPDIIALVLLFLHLLR